MADGTPTPAVDQFAVDAFKLCLDQAVEAFNDYMNLRGDVFKAPEIVENGLANMRNAYYMLSGSVLALRDPLVAGLELQLPTSKYQDLIGGIMIFNKYDHLGDIWADHDIIYAGPDPMTVSTEDTQALGTFGWYADDSYDCFYHYT